MNGSTLTKQGLQASLLTVLEFGFKCAERGENLESARANARPFIETLSKCGNLPDEILRIETRKR